MAESKFEVSGGNGGSTPVCEVSYLDREIRMVLVGKTGVGKSATGNTIIGCNVFTQSASAASVTKKCKQHSFQRDGYDLHLVDTPGFYDTERSAEDIRKEVGRCVALSSPGIHAILFIVKVDRYTDEDQKTVDAFIQCFGEGCRKYCLVIFTGGDTLDNDDKTIDEFIKPSLELRQFLSSIENRHMVVNNTNDSLDKETFTLELVTRVLQMVQTNGGKCYTNEMYREAEIELKKAEDERVEKIKAEKRALHDEELRKLRLSEEENARKVMEKHERELQEREEANKARNEKLLQEKQALHEEELRKLQLSKEEHARKMKEEQERALKEIEEANKARNEKLLQEKQALHEEELRKLRLREEEHARKMKEKYEREMKEREDKIKQEARRLVRQDIEDGTSLLDILFYVPRQIISWFS